MTSATHGRPDWVVKFDYYLSVDRFSGDVEGAAVAWDAKGGFGFMAFRGGQWVEDQELGSDFWGGDRAVRPATRKQAETADCVNSKVDSAATAVPR